MNDHQAMHRERVEIDKRRMSPARRARILAHHEGRCAYPGCEVAQGLQIDHVVALALGGKDRDENLEPLCRLHHVSKTALDMKMISKANRIIRREDGTRRERKAIPGQKLQGGKFQTRLTKGFDGVVRLRATTNQEDGRHG